MRRALLIGAALALIAGAAQAYEPKEAGVARGWPAGPGRVPATLSDLSLSSTSATEGQAYSATVNGSTAASTLSLTDSVGGKYSLSGTTLSGSGLTQGTDHPVIRETLAGATNSPHSTTLSVTVAAAGGSSAAALLLLLL